MYYTNTEAIEKEPLEAIKFFVDICVWKGISKEDIMEHNPSMGFYNSLEFVISNLTIKDFENYVKEKNDKRSKKFLKEVKDV